LVIVLPTVSDEQADGLLRIPDRKGLDPDPEFRGDRSGRRIRNSSSKKASSVRGAYSKLGENLERDAIMVNGIRQDRGVRVQVCTVRPGDGLKAGLT